MSNIFTKHPLYLLVRCALPHCVSSMFFSIYYIVDGIFVGKFLGSEDLAVMGLIMPFVIIGFALTDMIAIGSSVRISLALGKGKPKEASILFSTSLVVTFIFSCFIAMCAFFLAPFLIDLLAISESSKVKAKEFVSIFVYFTPLIMFYFALDNYLRICAKNMYSMLINILMALCNIFLDYLFIVVFGWGLFSAALSTCIGLSLTTILGFLPFVFGNVELKFSKILFRLKMLLNIFYNGSSVFLGNISGSTLTIVANFLLLKLAGESGVATFSIILYIDAFIIAFIMSLCEGMQPALSYNYAKKDKVRLKSLIFYIFATTFLLCFGVFIAIMLWSESLITLFAEKTNQDFIVFSAFALSLYTLNYCITWFNVCVSSFLTAFNKASYSLLLSLVQGFFAPLCSLFVLTYLFGLNGIWCAAFVGDLLCVALSFALLKRAFNIGQSIHFA